MSADSNWRASIASSTRRHARRRPATRSVTCLERPPEIQEDMARLRARVSMQNGPRPPCRIGTGRQAEDTFDSARAAPPAHLHKTSKTKIDSYTIQDECGSCKRLSVISERN